MHTRKGRLLKWDIGGKNWTQFRCNFRRLEKGALFHVTAQSVAKVNFEIAPLDSSKSRLSTDFDVYLVIVSI